MLEILDNDSIRRILLVRRRDYEPSVELRRHLTNSRDLHIWPTRAFCAQALHVKTADYSPTSDLSGHHKSPKFKDE